MAGPRVEVYGFVLWIVTFVAVAAYLGWAYLPESLLSQLGITYYPNKYWAIVIPTYIGVTWIVCVVTYISVNLICTAPLDSFDTIVDQYAQETSEDHLYRSKGGIPPIADIPITTVNKLLYQPQERAIKRDRSHLSFSSDRIFAVRKDLKATRSTDFTEEPQRRSKKDSL